MSSNPKNTKEYIEFMKKEQSTKVDTRLVPPWLKTLEELESEGKIPRPKPTPTTPELVEKGNITEGKTLEKITNELGKEFPKTRKGEPVARIKADVPLDYAYIYNSLRELRKNPGLITKTNANKNETIKKIKDIYQESRSIQSYFQNLKEKTEGATTFLGRVSELANILGLEELKTTLTETETTKPINEFNKLELYLISYFIKGIYNYTQRKRETIIKGSLNEPNKKTSKITMGEIYQEVRASEILKEDKEKAIYLVDLADGRRIITGFKQGEFQTLPEEDKHKYVIKTYKKATEEEEVLELDATMVNTEKASSKTLMFNIKNLETIASEGVLNLKAINKNTFRGIMTQAKMSEKTPEIKPQIHYFETLENGEVVVIQEYVEENTLEKFLRTTKEISLRDYLNMMKSTLKFYENLKGFVHRDFKPDNAFINDNEEISPTDFDIAIDIDRFITDREYRKNISSGFTGTINYAAPELLNLKGSLEGKRKKQAREQLRKIDNYIVGSVFTKILSGKYAIDNIEESDKRMFLFEKQYRLSKTQDKNAGKVVRKENNGKTIYSIHKPKGVNIGLQEKTIDDIFDMAIDESLKHLIPKKDEENTEQKIKIYLATKETFEKDSEEKPEEKPGEKIIKDSLKKTIKSYDLKTRAIAETVYHARKLLSERGDITQEQIINETMKEYEGSPVSEQKKILPLIKRTSKVITKIYKPISETQLMLYAMLMPNPEHRFSNEESLHRINRIFEKYDNSTETSLLDKITVPSPTYKTSNIRMGEKTFQKLFGPDS